MSQEVTSARPSDSAPQANTPSALRAQIMKGVQCEFGPSFPEAGERKDQKQVRMFVFPDLPGTRRRLSSISSTCRCRTESHNHGGFGDHGSAQLSHALLAKT